MKSGVALQLASGIVKPVAGAETHIEPIINSCGIGALIMGLGHLMIPQRWQVKGLPSL